MKIPLRTGASDGRTQEAARTEALGRDLKAAKHGDWEAKHRIESKLTPLLSDLAKKRGTSNAEINALMDAGKKGIAKAVKKYKPSMGADRFQIFALQFIEEQMDSPNSGGFFSKLFGG